MNSESTQKSLFQEQNLPYLIKSSNQNFVFPELGTRQKNLVPNNIKKHQKYLHYIAVKLCQ